MKTISIFLQGRSVLRFVGLIAAVSLMTGCIGDEEEETDNVTVVSSSGSEGGSSDSGSDEGSGDNGSGDNGSGGGSGDNGSGGGSGASPTLTIGGTPPSQIMAGSPFTFTPTVGNPDGVPLSFSASNLPSWAFINGTTGEISGTPGAGDVGTHENITVTVSGGGTSVTSPALSVEVVAVANGSATLSWVAPTQNTDGSPLTNLAGFRVYWGQSPSSLDNSIPLNNAGITTYLVEQLTPATWYFSVSAIDTDGIESTLSNIASKTIT